MPNQKIETKQVTVRMPVDLIKKLIDQAQQERRTMSSHIIYVLERSLKSAGADWDQAKER